MRLGSLLSVLSLGCGQSFDRLDDDDHGTGSRIALRATPIVNGKPMRRR
jgi:hypothetical protein